MSARQHAPFYGALGALGALFLLACAYVYLSHADYAKTDAALRRVNNAVVGLAEGVGLAGAAEPVALTDANVAAAKADLAALQARQVALRGAISGSAENQIDSRFVGIANELGTQIQESVQRWRRLALSKEIRLSSRDETSFGFRRYARNVGTQPQRLYREVDRQRKIIEWLLETLVEARAPGSPVLLLSIDREPIETFPAVNAPAGDAQGFSIDTPSAEVLAVRLQPDEFVLTGHSFRRPGLVGSFAFRVRFVGRTDTLRAFVNLVQNSGKPVAISGIEVAQPNAEVLKELLAAPTVLAAPGAPVANVPPPAFFPAFGSDSTSSDKPATKAERIPVVPSGASEFTLRLEYLFPIDAPPAK